MPAEEEPSPPARAARRDGVVPFVASRTLSVLGDLAALTALSIHIYQTSGSATMVSGLFAVRVLPRLFGPLAGALADRYDLRNLLVTCDLAAFLLFLAIAVVQPSYWPLLGMILVAESIATVSVPAARAWGARRISALGRARFNGLLSAGTAIGFGAGAGVGGLTAAAFGVRWALLVNALSFVVSAALVLAARSAPPVAGAAWPRLISSAAVVLCILRGDRRVAAVSVGIVGLAFAAAVDRPAVVALAVHEFPGAGAAYGLILGMISLGALAASLSVGRVGALNATGRVFLVSIVVQALGHLGPGLAPWPAVAALTALVMGVGNGVETVVGFTLLQAAAPAGRVGAVVATVISMTFIADATGSLIGGPLVDALGARPVFAVAALLMAGCAALSWRLVRRDERVTSGA